VVHPARFNRFVRWIFYLALAGCLVYIFWLPDVPWLLHHNPTKTSLMQLRQEQAELTGRSLKSVMIWKPLDEISPYLRHAIVLAEDDTFYQHNGFDFEQIQVALQRDWAKKRFVYGGSTITQQLARTLYLSPKKNLLRKAKEAAITVYLEHTLPKKRILELYLNVAEWGRGIYGAEAAARNYYNKSAADLTPDEAVSLASILPSPRRWSPLSEHAFMARRRTGLIERMQRAGYIPPALPSELPAELPVVVSPDDLQGEEHPSPETEPPIPLPVDPQSN